MKNLLNKNLYKQYFTPPRVAEFILDVALKLAPPVGPRPYSLVDPACGGGVFISRAVEMNVAAPERSLGIDMDETLEGRGDFPEGCQRITADGLTYDTGTKFRIAAGNPPFGLIQLDDEMRKAYEDFDLFNLYTEKGKKKPKAFPVEVLFLERFLRLTRSSGVTAIILPVGIFTNVKMKYIREWLRLNHTPLGLVFIESRIFQAVGTPAKTAVLFVRPKKNRQNSPFFMASTSDVDLSGKRRDGLDEIRDAAGNSDRFTDNETLAFYTDTDSLEEDRWDPLFHHPMYREYYEKIRSGGFQCLRLGELMSARQIVTAWKGPQILSDEPEAVPYITSRHITRAGIDFSPKDSFIDRGSPGDTPRSRIRPGDVLLVRSGEGCIGRSIVAEREDSGYNIRSEIYILRPDPGKINPAYLSLYLHCFRLPFRKRKKKEDYYCHFQVKRYGRGVGTPNLNKAEILSILIPIIPEKVQKEVETRYQEIQRLASKATRDKVRATALPEGSHYIENYCDFVKVRAEKEMDDLINDLERFIEGKTKIFGK